MKHIANFIQKKPGLKNIKIDFSNYLTISKTALIALGKSLEAQTDLKNLTLMFRDCTISKTGFEHISKAIGQLPFLESLYLDFNRANQLPDEFCEDLANNMSSLAKSLKTVKLILPGSKSGHIKNLEAISQSFTKLHLLENISLEIFNQTQLLNESLMSLGKSFKALKYLINVHVALEECTQVTDQSVESLCEGLWSASLLESVDLSFNVCNLITNESLKSLSKCFKRLGLLRNVSLKLKRCREITDAGIRELKETLKRKELLRSVNLILSGCSNVTSKDFFTLMESLKKMNSLHTLDYDYYK